MERILHYSLLVFFVLLWLKAAVVKISYPINFFEVTRGYPAWQECFINELCMLVPVISLIILALLILGQPNKIGFYISSVFLLVKGLFLLWLWSTGSDFTYYSWSGLVTPGNVRLHVRLQFAAAVLSVLGALTTTDRRKESKSV